MLAALRVEFSKFYRHRASYLGFALLLAMSGLVVLAAAKEREHAERRLKQQLQSSLGDEFIVAGKVTSAVTIPRMILFAKLPMYVFVASLAAMSAGSAVATEYSSGTLRTVLTRPVRRSSLVLAKWVLHAVHAAALTMFLGASGLALGYIFLGSGDLVWVMEGLQIVPEGEAVRELALAYALQSLSMVAVASIALCVSCAVSRGATAAGVTLAFLLLSLMLGVLPFESLDGVRPYLLTTHMSQFEHVLDDTVDWPAIRHAALWVTGYAAAGLVGAIAILSRREIRC
jgi:ABC-2 type transport system permease protein